MEECRCHDWLRILHSHLLRCFSWRICWWMWRCSHSHRRRIVGSGFVRVITFIFPISVSMVQAKLVTRRVERPTVFQIFCRFVLEGKSGYEARRGWWLRAILVLVPSTAKQETASKKHSGSSKDTQWNTNAQTDLLSSGKFTAARWGRDGIEGCAWC
jgi:hypothetical protein